MNQILSRFCISILIFALYNASAADKLVVVINHQTISAWRTADLDRAKQEAQAEHKAIAWIAADPTAFDGRATISSTGSKGATLHAFYALRDRTVLVYMDAFAENHKCLPLVDHALHTPNPDYTVPTVVFLDPEAKHVLAKVPFESNFVKRAEALADALEQVKEEMSAAPATPQKSKAE